MWDVYRPQIIKWVFLPFLAYMLTFLSLVIHSSTGYTYLLAIRGEGKEEEYEELFLEHNFHFYSRIYLIASTFCASYLCQYSYMEYREMRDNPLEYLSDYWNFFDMSTLCSNMAFLFTLNSPLCLDMEYDAHFIRLVGGIGCFFLWIKVFYWMRLF